MKGVAASEVFDRADLNIHRLVREHKARTHGFVTDKHRASAANSVLAADMRAG
jgi:hypothetical protein